MVVTRTGFGIINTSGGGGGGGTHPGVSTVNAVAKYLDATGGLANSNVLVDASNNFIPGAAGLNIGLDGATSVWGETRTTCVLAVEVVNGGTLTRAAQGGGVLGRIDGAGASIVLGGAAYDPTSIMANSYAAAGDTALVSNTGGGSTMIGSAFAYGGAGATAELLCPATSFGAFAGGYPLASGGGTARVQAAAPGSFVWAYPVKANAGTSVVQTTTTAAGSFVVGRVEGTGNHTMQATQPGCFVAGIMTGGAANGTMEATGAGSMVVGRTVASGVLRASAQGAGAFGNVTLGQTSIASAENSWQFGPGSGLADNTEADTISAGTGIRIKGTDGAPAAPRAGDIWPTGTDIAFRSSGVNVVLSVPTITGSRAGNAALASLLTALATDNLIVDSTSA